MSFRGRILTVVIAASVVPLALVGLWLTAGTVRSGDRFLNQRLHGALDATVSLVATEWVQLRSALLFLGDHATVQQVLNDEGTSVPAPARGDLDRRFNALDPAVRSVRILDRGGTEVWGMRRRAEAVTASSRDVLAEYGTVHQSVPIHERLGGERIGSLQVTLDPSVLLPPAQLPAITAGMVLALANADGGLATPTPFEATMLAEDRFVWAGDEWTTGRRGAYWSNLRSRSSSRPLWARS